MVAFLIAATACGGGASTGSAAKGEILVFAAASLTESFTAIGRAFEGAHPGVHVRFNFGPSDGLATGISEGGNADVFAAASADPMDVVARSPGVRGRTVFAGNRLVAIIPRDNPAGIRSLADIVRANVKLSIAAPGVPAGKYARQILARAHLARALRNSPSNEVDVKSVVQKVVLGEADAGIVYATDVTSAVSKSVRVVPIEDELNVIARYPIAVVAWTKHEALARAFVAYVSGEGQATLRAAGFLSPA